LKPLRGSIIFCSTIGLEHQRNIMAQYGNRYAPTGAVVDQGLRAFMLSVYNYMAGGLLVTGVLAYATASAAVTGTAGHYQLTELGQALFASPLKWVLMFAPLAFSVMLGAGIPRMSTSAAQIAFWAFAAVMGVSLSVIFLVFTKASITQAFFSTAAAFTALSLYGYTTRRDLSGWGSFLLMGLVGMIVVSILNFFFLHSSAIQFAVSALVVLISAGLTAYHTQSIKDLYFAIGGDAAHAGKLAILGALNLYIDFINMFTSLLSLIGDRE
jgi:FtsH-binding integral membrane protein